MGDKGRSHLMNQREEYVMFLQLVKKNTYITLTATQGRFWCDTHTKTVSSDELHRPKT